MAGRAVGTLAGERLDRLERHDGGRFVAAWRRRARRDRRRVQISPDEMRFHARTTVSARVASKMHSSRRNRGSGSAQRARSSPRSSGAGSSAATACSSPRSKP